jgi:hypothetical protein
MEEEKNLAEVSHETQAKQETKLLKARRQSNVSKTQR